MQSNPEEYVKITENKETEVIDDIDVVRLLTELR